MNDFGKCLAWLFSTLLVSSAVVLYAKLYSKIGTLEGLACWIFIWISIYIFSWVRYEILDGGGFI